MRLALFYHSVISNLNHGMARFLRGIMRTLRERRHQVIGNEVEENWPEYIPVPLDPDRACDSIFTGTRMLDREERVLSLFFRAAALAPGLSFVPGSER